MDSLWIKASPERKTITESQRTAVDNSPTDSVEAVPLQHGGPEIWDCPWSTAGPWPTGRPDDEKEEVCYTIIQAVHFPTLTSLHTITPAGTKINCEGAHVSSQNSGAIQGQSVKDNVHSLHCIKCMFTLALHKDTLSLQKDTLSLHKDTLSLQKDTLSLHKDTLSLQKDTLALHKDTLSLQKDTLSLHKDTLSLQKDTLALHKDRPTGNNTIQKSKQTCSSSRASRLATAAVLVSCSSPSAMALTLGKPHSSVLPPHHLSPF